MVNRSRGANNVFERACLQCGKNILISDKPLKRQYERWDGQIVHRQNSFWCCKRCCLTHRNRTKNPLWDKDVQRKVSENARKRKSYLHLQTPEARAKQAKTISGKGHWNWRGGKTKENKLLRTHADYKDWRKKVLERDDYTCQICGVRGGYLEVDHIKPWALYPEYRLDLSNGRTLCKPCHKKTSTYMSKIRWHYKQKKGWPSGDD